MKKRKLVIKTKKTKDMLESEGRAELRKDFFELLKRAARTIVTS